MAQDWKSSVLQNFDDNVESYELYSGVQERAAWRLNSLLVGQRHSMDILEVGCGTGLLTRHLLEHYPESRFLVTDIAPHMLRQARKNLREVAHPIQWMVLDGENANLGRSFDLIVANMAVQWFEDIEGGLIRLARYLKPSGRLYYSIPGPRNFHEWKDALNETGLHSGGMTFKAPPGLFEEEEIEVRYKDSHEFLRALKKTGSFTPRADYKSLSTNEMRKALRLCDQKYNGRMTWHILYGCLDAKDYAAS